MQSLDQSQIPSVVDQTNQNVCDASEVEDRMIFDEEEEE